MAFPVLIGLPGSGKSTVSELVAKSWNVPYISTDELFREYRAMPETSLDPAAQVMRNFLEEAEIQFPNEYPELKRLAQVDPNDPKGRSFLRDSTLFRKIGEKPFRLFENEMIQWLHTEGKFDGAIVDLSSSAITNPTNRALFQDRIFVLLDASQTTIMERLFNDYLSFELRSDFAGEDKPLRGGYEKAVREAIARKKDEGHDGLLNGTIFKTLQELHRKHSSERLSLFKHIAGHSIYAREKDTPRQTANMVMDIFKPAGAAPTPGI